MPAQKSSVDYRHDAQLVRDEAATVKSGLVRTELIGVAMAYDGVAALMETIERVRKG